MSIVDLINKNCEIPPLPAAATQILRLVDDPQSSVDKLADVVMADQAFAARLLKIANSSYYSGGRAIETVSDAIMTLGSSALRTLAVAASARTLFRKFGLLEQKLWEHSIGVSSAAGIVASAIRYPSAEEAAVVGLVHDIGKVIMNNGDPEKYMLVTESVYNENKASYMAEEFFFGFNHADVGGVVGRNWKFPKNLCEAIRRHHSIRTAADISDLPEDAALLCCIIALADGICVRLGIGYREPMDELPLLDRESQRMLDISDRTIQEMTDKIRARFEEEKSRHS